jgi:DNA-binding CsgD family transcriptional regulator/heme exporter protein D
VGSETGFYDISLADYKKNVYLTKVKITNVQASGVKDTLLFGGYRAERQESNSATNEGIPAIRHKQNSFHFEYSSPCYGYQQNVQYSVMLQGVDAQWSPWLRNPRKDYINLPAGTFTFRVKAKTNLGQESNIDSYSFIILPPWYNTWWAYLIYVLVLAGLTYAIHTQHRKLLLKQQEKHEEEQRQLQYLYKLELENSQKEIIALRNQKLKAELEGKNSELASVAMHVVHKGEILSKIKDELVRLKKTSEAEGTNDNVSKLIKSLNEEARLDQEWDQFAAHFDSIHGDFIKVLKTAYPNLTHNDVKLCTYLHMNLSSKEIAQLLNISVRGVEISRYRLRKKLQIPTETNLYYFFLEFLSARKQHSLENEESKTTGIDK